MVVYSSYSSKGKFIMVDIIPYKTKISRMFEPFFYLKKDHCSFVMWLVETQPFHPKLVLFGPPGSFKTTLSKVALSLFDIDIVDEFGYDRKSIKKHIVENPLFLIPKSELTEAYQKRDYLI